MARQIVRESFYIYCNRFREFFPFACICVGIYFTLYYFSSLSFLLAPLLIITCEIPCYCLYYNKPIQALCENPGTILFFSICNIAVVSVSRYSFALIQQLMSSGIEIFITKLLFNVILTVLQVSVTFLLIYSVKKNCKMKESLSKYADIFSSNRAWKVWLYVRVCLVEIGYMLAFIIVILIIPFLIRAFLPFTENLITKMVVIFFSILEYAFFPYTYIRMCNYCEEIC